MKKLESELLNDLRKGNVSAFNVIFKTHYTGLVFYAYDYLKELNLSRQVVQDVFIKLWENNSSIHIKSSLKAYLYRMVYNKSMDFLKQHSKVMKKEVQIDDTSVQIDLLLSENAFEPFEDIYSEQMEAAFESAIMKLPDQCREVFILSRYKNLSYPKIANKLGISVSSVKSQIKRAMDKLVIAMDKYLDK